MEQSVRGGLLEVLGGGGLALITKKRGKNERRDLGMSTHEEGGLC